MESDGDDREPVSVTTGPSASCAVLSAMTKSATLFVGVHRMPTLHPIGRAVVRPADSEDDAELCFCTQDAAVWAHVPCASRLQGVLHPLAMPLAARPHLR